MSRRSSLSPYDTLWAIEPWPAPVNTICHHWELSRVEIETGELPAGSKNDQLLFIVKK